jgi:hypothetical protein
MKNNIPVNTPSRDKKMKNHLKENSIGRMNILLIAIAFACFDLAPLAEAIVPAPDGGYPGGNTAEGQAALFSLTSGTYNTAVGVFSLRSNAESNFNTAIGAGTLLLNTAENNTAIGAGALLSKTTGALNTAEGYEALFSNTRGLGNTANGVDALLFNTTGSGNVAIGLDAGSNITTANYVIAIGTSGQNVSSSCYIDQIFGSTSIGGSAVFVNEFDKLGTITSSRRFKDHIKPMDKASEVILALKPVTFCYKKEIDPAGKSQFGLVAEQVADVNPDLVVRDKQGKPYTVRYDQVNAMLLNEFLKEHRKIERQAREIEEQNVTISELKKGMATIVAHLKEQDSNIQKVSAQIETGRFATDPIRSGDPAPQVVLNNP